MSIFGNLFGKKDAEHSGNPCDAVAAKKPACNCGGACKPPSDDGTVVITVMGTGCKKCHQLHQNALEAAEGIDRSIRVEYVTDIVEIAAAGVMSTPALLVDGKIASTGKLLSAAEVRTLVKKEIGA